MTCRGRSPCRASPAAPDLRDRESRGPDALLRPRHDLLADLPFRLRAEDRSPTARRPEAGSTRSNALCTPEHGGTHLDAPSHFAKGGLTADQIPVRQLVSPGRRDRRPRAGREGSRLPPDPRRREGLGEGARADAGGRDRAPARPAGARAGRTGRPTWGTTRPATLRSSTSRRTARRPPGISCAERKVAALGVDTASIDYGPFEGFRRARDRQRRERVRPRERRQSRGAARVGRVGRRAADEDRRRLGRPAPHRRAACRDGARIPSGCTARSNPAAFCPRSPAASTPRRALSRTRSPFRSAPSRSTRPPSASSARPRPRPARASATRSPGSSASAGRCRTP